MNMTRVNPDLTKTTVLNEFIDFCNKARLSLINLKADTIADLKKAFGMNKIKCNLNSVVSEFDKKINKQIDKVDLVEEELTNYYHCDDLTTFVRKTNIAKNFVESIIAGKVGNEKIA